MAYPRIDTSPLFQQLPPSPMSGFMGNVGGIVEAMMARRREAERQAVLDKQKADELQFRRDQEQRLTTRQEAADARQAQIDTRQEARDARGERLKGYEAVAKAKPNERALIAQIYGGKVAPAQPNYTDENDPLGPGVQMLSDVQDDASSPLGFSYGMNPEFDRRTKAAEGKQVLTMPGGDPIEMDALDAEQDHYSQAEAQVRSMPPSPMRSELLNRIALSRAAGVDGKTMLNEMQDERQLAASERNARIVASRQERASALADDRAEGRDRAAAMKEFQKLKQKALASDRELAAMADDITTSGGIPAGAEGYGLFKGRVERAAGGIGLMESGNPGAEISDRTKERLGDRMATGRMGAIAGKALGYLGIETAASPKIALKKIKAEQAAIRAKLREHAQTYGLDPSAADLDGPGSAPAKGGGGDDDARLKRMGF